MEIKFRGLRTDGNGWIIGNLFVPNQLVKGVYICETTTFADFAPSFEEGDDIEEAMSHGCALGRFIEVKPETVGQFTGLTDKNGKEIYSGDIVRQSDNLCIIERCVGGYECQMLIELKKGGVIEGSTYDFSFLSDKYCEVIGNKFEHSELLNK